MATTSDPEFKSPLPLPQRLITTHNKEGKAVYSQESSETISFWAVGPPENPVGFGLGYATSSFPINLENNQDLDDFRKIYGKRREGSLVRSGGTVLRYVDFPPQSPSPMHRTVSCDYAIMVHGELESLLDSGETRTLKPGDILIQRGTMHQWNNHKDEWARMLFVLLDAHPVKVDGQALGEDLGDMQGVSGSH